MLPDIQTRVLHAQGPKGLLRDADRLGGLWRPRASATPSLHTLSLQNFLSELTPSLRF